MAKQYALTADKRTVTGRKVKQLRRQQLIPANLYGKKIASTALQLKATDFIKLFADAGETNIVTLSVTGDKQSHPVLISNVQVDPLSGYPIHVDLRQVVMTEAVKASIPVELVGESPAVKEKSAIIVTAVQEIEVEALPGDLPSEIQVDISALTDIGQSILLKDIKLDRTKITLSMPEDTTLVTTQAQVVEEEAPAPEAEAEAEGEAAPEAEGEAAEAGETKEAPEADAKAKA